VGVIEAGTVRHYRMRAGDGVVEHAFHAVAVAGVARRTQQISSDLEVTIRSARCLEAGVRGAQACIEQTLPGRNEGFIRSPTPCSEALLMNKLQTILRCAQIFLIAALGTTASPNSVR